MEGKEELFCAAVRAFAENYDNDNEGDLRWLAGLVADTGRVSGFDDGKSGVGGWGRWLVMDCCAEDRGRPLSILLEEIGKVSSGEGDALLEKSMDVALQGMAPNVLESLLSYCGGKFEGRVRATLWECLDTACSSVICDKENGRARRMFEILERGFPSTWDVARVAVAMDEKTDGDLGWLSRELRARVEAGEMDSRLPPGRGGARVKL